MACEIAPKNANKQRKSGVGSACPVSMTRVVAVARWTSAASSSPAAHCIAALQPRNEGGAMGLTTAVDNAVFCGTINSIHAGGLMSSHPAPQS
jgi:hypothetical protein